MLSFSPLHSLHHLLLYGREVHERRGGWKVGRVKDNKVSKERHENHPLLGSGWGMIRAWVTNQVQKSRDHPDSDRQMMRL